MTKLQSDKVEKWQRCKVTTLQSDKAQLRLVDNKLIGPGQNTTRQVDQLICLDDRSDIADVRDLLEHAHRTASLAGVEPVPNDLHPAHLEHGGWPALGPPLADDQPPFPALAQDDHSQDPTRDQRLIVNWLLICFEAIDH